jgi:hypothetical protein
LFNINLNDLKVILENIRVELNLSRNKEMFSTLVNASLIGIEKVSSYCNYNIDGFSNELMNDPSFQYDLKIIQCEIDCSKYINVKSSCFLKIVKTMYQKNKENEIKK